MVQKWFTATQHPVKSPHHVQIRRLARVEPLAPQHRGYWGPFLVLRQGPFVCTQPQPRQVLYRIIRVQTIQACACLASLHASWIIAASRSFLWRFVVSLIVRSLHRRTKPLNICSTSASGLMCFFTLPAGSNGGSTARVGTALPTFPRHPTVSTNTLGGKDTHTG